MDAALFRRLLAEGEGSRLDYKQEPYELADALVDKKAEILKDILALANAWGEADAYILFGVVRGEVGAPARVTGITRHLDDADLQQFIGGKTNTTIEFSYQEFRYDGKPVAALHIPRQRRPFFLVRRYGGLEANTVYIRRGSSTGIADPSEVFDMGAASLATKAPILELQFGNLAERAPLGQHLRIESLIFSPALENDQLPRGRRGMYLPSENEDFWIEVRDYLVSARRLQPVHFVVRNVSGVVANGVRVELLLPRDTDVLVTDELPAEPHRDRLATIRTLTNFRPGVTLSEHAAVWRIELNIGKVQPRCDEWTDGDLFICFNAEREIALTGRIVGDDFEPIPATLFLVGSPRHRPMTLEDVKSAARNF